MPNIKKSKRNKLLNNLAFFHFRQYLQAPARQRKKMEGKTFTTINSIKYKISITH